MIFYSVLEIIAVIFGLVLFVHLYKRKKNVPPGPNKLPILGNILQMGISPNETLKIWSKKFGPIFSLNICGQKLVFLNDPKWIREMFNQPTFNGKPQDSIFTNLSKGSYGVLNSEGEIWEAHRRFTLRGLRDFGFSKSSMEGLIMNEVSEVLEWLKDNDGKVVSVGHKFSISVLNSLWTIINGERNKRSDSKIEEMLTELTRSVTLLFQRGLFVVPWLCYIFPDTWTGHSVFDNAVDELHRFVRKSVEKHKKDYVLNNPRDFIDCYLDQISNAKTDSHFYKDDGEKHMISSLAELLLAGSETSSTTLTWAMLYLAHHPTVQFKMQQEIDSIVGNGRHPLLTDRPNMPFTESVMNEVLRKSTILPFGVPHRATHDKEFGGYLIEKDTLIIAHLQYVMNNNDVWGDPENFRPERFLSEGGSKVLKHQHLIPFQSGKRQCLGKNSAKDTIFLFLANIFQQFEVLPDPDDPKSNFVPQMSILNQPRAFKILIKLRNSKF